jgi:hypothetical protein
MEPHPYSGSQARRMSGRAPLRSGQLGEQPRQFDQRNNPPRAAFTTSDRFVRC